MKAIILARVSTEEQREAGNSIPAQLVRMESYCQRNSFEIVERFSFDESAYKTKRDEFDKIIEFVNESKEKIVICFDKVDRLSRNIFDKRVALLYEKAVNNEIELHFVSDAQVVNNNMSAGDKFAFGMKLGLSKYYSDAISDNTRRAFEQKRRNGEWTGQPRTGYINVTLDNGKKDIAPDPERAHIVERLFLEYSNGNHSITSIWQLATKMGLTSRNGKPLSRSNVDLILKDKFYIGIAHSKKYGFFNHRHGQIISRDLFDRCQSVMEGRAKKPSKILSKNSFLFKGLLTCKDCGCLMSPEIHKGRFIYYSCSNGKRICKKVYTREEDLLKPINGVFEAFKGIPEAVQANIVSELRKLNEGQVEYHQKQIERIRGEYNRVEKRVNALLDLRLDQSITSDEYDKKLQELKDTQYRLNIELEEYTKADHEYHIHVNTVLNISRRVKEIFEGSEVHEKRAILNFLLQNPTVQGKNLEFTLRKPFDTVLELTTCPNWLRG